MKRQQYDPASTFPEFMTKAKLQEQFSHIAQKAEGQIKDFLSKESGILWLIDQLKGETDWRMLRIWLALLDNYANVISLPHKKMLLEEMFPMLVHPKGTVRRLSADSMGRLLGECDLLHSNLWDWFLRKLLFSDSVREGGEEESIGFAVKKILERLLNCLEERERKAVLSVYVSYFKSARWDDLTCFCLIAGIEEFSYEIWNNVQLHYIFGFLRHHLAGEQKELRLISLRLIKNWLEQGILLSDDMRDFLEGLELQKDSSGENYLLVKIWDQIDAKTEEKEKYISPTSSELIWKNLRFLHSGISKVINLSILKERAQHKDSADRVIDLSKYATHLLNLLRLSTEETIFLQAGEDLVEIMPCLEENQKNEIIQEVLKDYELGGDSTNYVPFFMERAFFHLTVEEQMEFFPRFQELFHNKDSNVVKTTLEISARILKKLADYCKEHSEEKKETREIFRFFGGLLCCGMFHHQKDISTETLFLMKNVSDACKNFEEEYYKEDLFCLLKKTLISLMRENAVLLGRSMVLTLKSVADCLESLAKKGWLTDQKDKKIAYFPGTFSSFSYHHKAMIKEIMDMGFEVYIRRRILYEFVADLKDVWMFPENVFIDLASAEDLNRLKNLFADREVYIVMGTEEIENNEAYWEETGEEMIYQFPHIFYAKADTYQQLDNYAIGQMIQNDVIYLRLPALCQKNHPLYDPRR